MIICSVFNYVSKKTTVATVCLILVLFLSNCSGNNENELEAQEKEVNEDAVRQIPKDDSIILNSSYASNSLYCISYSQDRRITEGTCFIVSHHRKYYLVSNYHVFFGRAANDTTSFLDSLNIEVDRIKVKFYREGGGFVDTNYVTKSFKRSRLIISKPANKFSRRVLDLALLPIDVFPKNSKISYINVDSIDIHWTLNSESTMFLYGFRHDEKNVDHIVGMDKVRIVSDRSFAANDTYILSISQYALKGDSGAPTYAIIGGKIIFIGIHSETIDPQFQKWLPEIFSHLYNAPISVSLSAANLFDPSLFGNKNM